jgi:hypothetical protein
MAGAGTSCRAILQSEHRSASSTSIQNDSGLPQGPDDRAIGRLDERRADLRTAIACWYHARRYSAEEGGPCPT